MSKRNQSFFYAVMGVIVGFIIIGLIKNGEVDWKRIGDFLLIVFLILLLNLGLGLYKKRG